MAFFAVLGFKVTEDFSQLRQRRCLRNGQRLLELLETYRQLMEASDPAQPSQSQEQEVPEDDEDDEELQEEARFEMDEQEFSFKDFVKKFAAPQVVRAYVTLLKDFQDNSTHTNHCLVKMLHRLAYDTGLQAMLFQASLFRVFQKIICDPVICKSKQYQELANFATHIVRKFFEVAVKNEKVFVELFFYKSVKEAIEITGGYGCTIDKPVRWNEEEQMELTRLYEEYRDHEDGEMDVVDHIMARLINQDRTRRQVVRQMVTQELIGSAREVKKKKPSERAAAWREDEQHELARLHEEFKDAGGDVVDHIMSQLANQGRTRRQVVRQLVMQELVGSAKELRKKSGTGRTRGWREEEELELRELWDRWGRCEDPLAEILGRMMNQKSRAVVANKLLEIGLILDKKDLRKKRKTTGSRKSRRRGSDDDDDEEVLENGLPSDFEEEILSEKDESGVSSGSSSESDDNDEESDEPLYVTQIKKYARRAHKKGHSTAVEWVARSLTSVAEDREEDDDQEPVPLVPLTDEQEDAMEEKAFKVMLRKAGVHPPASEQERFWRIPGKLTPADLRSRAAALRETDKPQEGSGNSGKKSNSRFEALKALAKQKKSGESSRKRKTPRRTPLSQDSNQSDDGLNLESSPVNLDDGDQATPNQKEKNQLTRSSPVLGKKKKSYLARRKVDSDEDSADGQLTIDTLEEEQQVTDNPHEASQHRKRARVMDSASEESDNEPLQETAKRARLMDSASEESDNEPLQETAKRARVMESDKEEDKSENQQKPLESFPATILTQDLDDSDSDVEDHIPLKHAIKKNAIESDSDED